jgi:hypothetical protein
MRAKVLWGAALGWLLLQIALAAGYLLYTAVPYNPSNYETFAEFRLCCFEFVTLPFTLPGLVVTLAIIAARVPRGN